MKRAHRLSTLKLVRLGHPVRRQTLETLAVHLSRAFAWAIQRIELVQKESVPVEQIEAGLLTQALGDEVGGHILAITGADLIDSSSDDFSRYMLGGKDNRNDVAVVSTHRLTQRDRLSVGRLTKVSLHELGHNFGLVHHYSNVKEPGGELCPMTKGDFNRYGGRAYLRAVVDARGLSFCNDCLAFVRRAALFDPIAT